MYMKKLLLGLCAVPALSFGQITLDQSAFLQANDQLILSTSLDFDIDYLTTGANHTWDFTNLTPSGQRFTDCHSMSDASMLSNLLFGPLAATPYKASYFAPTTDIPLDQLTSFLPVTLEDISLFTKNTSTAINSVGYEFSINGQGIPAKSDTIETRYPLPLTYGDSYTSHGYTDLDMNPIYDAKWIQHRYRESVVDGWGSITTPYGTFDVLRINHKILETDSLYITFDTLGTWIGIPVPEAHEYEWRALTDREAILRVKTSVILGTEQVTSIEYRDEYNGLGIGEKDITTTVYPNPATEEISVIANGAIISMQVIDQRGQLIALPQAQINGKLGVLTVSPLSSGLYHLVIQTTDGVSTQLFAKE